MILLLLLFILLSPLSSQNINDELTTVAKNHQILGLSVGFFNRTDIFNAFTYGISNIQRQKPINDNTRYRIDSVAKHITATGLMILFDQGKFQLLDDISNYLPFQLRHPDYPEQPITVLQVLSHTSSLADGSKFSDFQMTSQASSTTNNFPKLSDYLVSGGKYYSTNNFVSGRRPGTYFNYANTNVGIIGTMIETITKTRFDTLWKIIFLNRWD